MSLSADLERELARYREEAEAARLAAFEPHTLAWLAVLPEWTTSLATQVGLAPAGDVDALVGRLEEAGLVERREVLGDDGRRQQAFWVRSAARPGLVRHLATARGTRLEHDVDELASAVERLDVTDAGLRVWLDVVRQYRKEVRGARLLGDVDRLCEQGRLGEATRVVATATVVGEVVAGTLADAARRAQWRVERAQRTVQDMHHLRHYFRRQDVERELDALLGVGGGPARDGTARWALHLLGAGGVGKTMVVRYLASGRYAEDRGLRPFPVARVDFDHLDPRYPQQRPADLLVGLGDELTGYLGTRTSYGVYRRFRDAADALHEELARTEADPARADDLLRQVVRLFSGILREVPNPAVLVLDTCEELAKLYGLGSRAPAIDRTFQLLEMLHETYPAVRVVLAGRRWLVPPPDPGRLASGPLLAPRPYLRVVTVAGFSPDEAEGYLDERERARLGSDPAAEPLPSALRAALLDRAREDGDGTPRYNPFELAAYCAWAFAEPDLDPAELAGAPGDPYVERRILGRLGDGPARDGLAVAAELGRFDLELAAPAWRRGLVDPEAAFAGIAAQEWVNVLSLDTAGRPRVIEIDEHLRERIRRVIAARSPRHALTGYQLGQDAAAVIARAASLADLPAETVEAAVRLLPPDEAGRLWQTVEDRVVAEGAWAWASQVTPRVAAVELARAEGGGPTVLAAILATQAGARIHTEPGQDVAQLWWEVGTAAGGHPDERVRAELAARALLGQVAAGESVWLLGSRGGDGLPDVAVLPAGSVVAAVEGALIRNQAGAGPDEYATRAAEYLAASPPSGMEAVAAVASLALAEHALVFAGPQRHALAASRADAAVALAERAGSVPQRPWADWVPPRGLLDRCRLTRLYVAFDRGEPLHAVPYLQWRDEATGRIDDIDAHRVVALSLAFELGHRPVDRVDLESIDASDRYLPSRRKVTWRHGVVPSVAVVLAEGWSALGQPERARDRLVRVREDALASGLDPDSVEACDLALLRLCRRYRTTEYAPRLRSLAREGSATLRAEAWRVLTLVEGEQRERPSDLPAPEAEPEHGLDGTLGRAGLFRWEVEALRSPAEAARGLRLAAERLARAGDRFDAAQAYLLAALASARTGERPDAEQAWQDYLQTVADTQLEEHEGWRLRRRVVRAYLAREDVTALTTGSRSPELDLAVPPPPTPPAAAPAYPPAQPAPSAQPGPPAEQDTAPPPEPVAMAPPPQAWGQAPPAPPPAPAARARSAVRLPLLVTLGVLAAVTVAVVLASLLAGSGGDTGPQPTVSATGSATGIAPTSPPPSGTGAGSSWPLVVGWVAGAVVATAGGLLLVALAADRGTRRRRGYRFAAARHVRVTITDGVMRVSAAGRRPSVRSLDQRRPPPLSGLVSRLAGSRSDAFHGWERPMWPGDRYPTGLTGVSLDLPADAGPRTLSLVQLDVDRDIGELGWEQWLGVLGSPERRMTTIMFRHVTGHLGWPDPPAAGLYRGPAHLAPRTTTEGRHGLAQFVGTPVPTSGLWRLRVAGTEPTVPAKGVRGTYAGEELLSLDSPGLHLAHRALVVLQAEPVDGPPEPLGDVRTGFLALARDALDGDAPAVLVLPPVPDELAAEAGRVIWAELARRQRPRPSDLVILAARLKALIAGNDRRGADAHLDVLLFLRTRL